MPQGATPGTRWLQVERWLARRIGGSPPASGHKPFRIGYLVPVLFTASVALWLLSTVPNLPPSVDTMRALTPWVGGSALIAEGLYLIRVVMRVVAICHQYAECHGDEQGIREVRRALLPVLNILVGVLLFAGVFCFQALDAIAETASVRVTRLLWMMTTGGLMLALVFGELVSRFADIAERIILRELQLAGSLSPSPGRPPEPR